MPHAFAELWRKHDFQSALLVTSASHMRQALGTFRKVGLPVVPSSADVQVVWPISRSVLAWMPDAEALQLSTKAAHELVGFLVDHWRGWL